MRDEIMPRCFVGKQYRAIVRNFRAKAKETEGPLIDRGIFPMKRRRRRRSKLEMQEFRQFQAAKKRQNLLAFL